MTMTSTAPGRVCLDTRLTSLHFDVDVGRVGDDVEHGGAPLRLGHQRIDLFARGVRVDVVNHTNAIEAVAHIAVDAKDALDVHTGLERCLDGPQLNLAILCNRSNTGRE